MPDLTENSNNFPSTFSRASSKWIDVSGTLTEFAVDVPSFGDTGLQLSSAATNQCQYSDDWTNTGWSATNASVATGVTSPQIVGRNTNSITDSGSGGGYAEYASGLIAFGSAAFGAVRLVTASGTVSASVGIYKAGVLQGSLTNVTVSSTPQIVQVVANGSPDVTTCDLRIIVNDASGVIYGNLAHIGGQQCAADIPTSGSSGARAADVMGYGVSGLPVNDLTVTFTTLVGIGNSLVYLYGDSNNFIGVSLATSSIRVFKKAGGTNYLGGLEAVSLTEGTEYTVTVSLSSSSGASATINSVTSSNANTTDLSTAIASVFPGSQTSATVQNNGGSWEIKNLKVEAL